MKNIVNILVEWGIRLKNKPLTKIIQSAINENDWYTTSEINLAIEAICSEMLQRDSLEKWLSEYKMPTKNPENVLIVMAGNIPLVGFFDLLCVVVSGHTSWVKPSHKDRVLIDWAINTLHEIEPTIPIYIYKDGEKPDRLIATGSDITRRYFEKLYPNTPTLLRGTRHSLAVVTDCNTDGLQEDTFSYSGLGCRNISLIFVPDNFDLSKLPRGVTHPKHHNNYLRMRALLTMNNQKFTDIGTHCLIESNDFPNEISQLSICRYRNVKEVEEWIEEHEQEIQCIVANSDAINHPRRVDFGRAQHPSLWDYADGVDTMKFLLNQE